MRWITAHHTVSSNRIVRLNQINLLALTEELVSLSKRGKFRFSLLLIP